MTDPGRVGPEAPDQTLFRRIRDNTGVRYVLIGGTSFIIDFGLIFVLHEVAKWPVWIATAVAFLASFAYNYTVQRTFAFTSQAPHGAALAKYTALVAVNTGMTVLVVTLFTPTVMGWGGGKVLATAITTAGNYLAYRYWIFPTRPNPVEGE